MAGKKSDRIRKTMNLLMLDEEHQKIKDYLGSVMKERNIRIIPLKEDLSHLIEIRKVLDNGELVAIHGDRFRDGARTITVDFMGRPAQLPEGPFYLAMRMGAPVSFAFAMKAGNKRYHFHATPPKTYDAPAGRRITEEHLVPLVRDYVAAVEEMLRKYPEQWFNYFDFWKA
jgi:predicted LPLAT superfamily acyltransferase